MDIVTPLIELLEATAWPVTTLVIVIMFRTELRQLLSRLKKGKVGPAEFEFAEDLKELASDIAETTITPGIGALTLKPEAVNLATLNPRGALLVAWNDIETALTNLAQKHGLTNDQTQRTTSVLVRRLAKANIIPPTHVTWFLDLRHLRNLVAHDADFKLSEDAALIYLEIAEKLKKQLVDAGKES